MTPELIVYALVAISMVLLSGLSLIIGWALFVHVSLKQLVLSILSVFFAVCGAYFMNVAVVFLTKVLA